MTATDHAAIRLLQEVKGGKREEEEQTENKKKLITEIVRINYHALSPPPRFPHNFSIRQSSSFTAVIQIVQFID